MAIAGIRSINTHSPSFSSGVAAAGEEDSIDPVRQYQGGAVQDGDLGQLLEKLVSLLREVIRVLSGWQAQGPGQQAGGGAGGGMDPARQEWMDAYNDRLQRMQQANDPAVRQHYQNELDAMRRTMEALGIPVENGASAGAGSGTSGPGVGAPAIPGGNGVEFGVNARPTWANSSYQKLTPDQQMQKVKEMGLSIYAFDINSGNAEQSREIIDAAERHGLKVQANLGMDRNKFGSFDDAYAAAKAEGAKVGQLFGDRVCFFQLDNELDSWVYENGSLNPQRLAVAEGIVKGLHDGVKETAPNVATIVNTTQAPTGIALLRQFQQDGVDWDVTGLHWYSATGDDITTSGGTGTTLENLHALGKPIAITEFNGQPNGGYGPTANRDANAEMIYQQMRDIVENAAKYNIISANLHELMNEPELGSAEGNYGMLDANGNFTTSSAAVTEFMSEYLGLR